MARHSPAPPLPFLLQTNRLTGDCTVLCQLFSFREAAQRNQKPAALKVINYKCCGKNFNKKLAGESLLYCAQCVKVELKSKTISEQAHFFIAAETCNVFSAIK